jgi:hypothetical protein
MNRKKRQPLRDFPKSIHGVVVPSGCSKENCGFGGQDFLVRVQEYKGVMKLRRVCLTEEDSGMLMSSVCIVHIACIGGKRWKRGQVLGLEGSGNGAVDTGQETSKDKDSQSCTRSRHSK